MIFLQEGQSFYEQTQLQKTIKNSSLFCLLFSFYQRYLILIFLLILMVSSRVFLLLLALLVVAQQQQAESKLIFVLSIIRHGARHPYQILGIGDDYAQKEHSAGQLTTQGKAMHYNLGKKMYEVYWKRLFGGTKYEHIYHPSRFYVQSTDVNRTIESAQAHLYGILQAVNPLVLSQKQTQYANPPYPGAHAVPGPVYGSSGAHVHPTPVHIYGRNMSAFDSGDFLTRFLEWECPNQHQWQIQNFENAKYQKMLKNETFEKAVAQLSRALGKPMDTKNFTSYYDNLECMHYYGKPVPDIFSKPSETQRALESLYALSSYVKFYGGDKQIRASANDLISKTIANMKKARDNLQLSEQWVIYSAHDITIGIILGVMNMWNAECIYNAYRFNQQHSQDCVIQFPPFASSLVFELYRSGQKYTFKVNYNGEHRKIPFCDNKKECEYQRLVAWYDTWKVEDVRRACGAPNYYTKEMLILLATGVIVTLIYTLIMRIVRGKDEKTKGA